MQCNDQCHFSFLPPRLHALFFISWRNRCLYANREISLDFSVYSRYCTCITHSTCIVSTFLFFGILTGCKPQYIALYCVNFPWRLFFLWFGLSLLYLLFVCSSKFHWICLTKENSANTPNDANKRLISRCLLLHLVRCFFYSELAGFFFSSKYTIRWPFVLPHNQYVLCYLLWCRGNVVAVVASCSRNSLPFLRRFVKMTLLFQFYHCLCRECNVTKKEETSEWMKLCYFSVLSSSC